MKVIQITIGRFHHFNVARQLEKHGLLKEIWTGYPQSKLKDEIGIPYKKIKSFPWVQTPYMLSNRLNLHRWDWLRKEWEWLAQETLDKHVAATIKSPTVVVAISADGLRSGSRAQKEGGYYVCDRCSSHIAYQDKILKEEYRKWGCTFHGVDPRIIGKEEAEYEQCDKINVPSEFVRRSFQAMGVPDKKIVKIPYGTRLERFKKTGEPDASKFSVLWVGAVSLRKGFMYLLQAFQKLKHPRKELVVIGAISPEMKRLLAHQNLSDVRFLSHVPNADLPRWYSIAHVFVLPSIEEGLAMVQGEALSCGCPVIATSHTGAEDLFSNGKEGFIVPIRSSESILEKLEELAQDGHKQRRMSESAVQKIKSLRGWDDYGDRFVNVINGLIKKEDVKVPC